jgi:hypothetical protein
VLTLTLACVFLILIVPVAAWALASKTTVVGLALAAALLTCGVGWFALVVGWTGPDQVANTFLVLTLATPALIMLGRLADRSAVVVPGAHVRLISGPSLAVVCAGLNILVFTVFIFTALYLGASYTPSSSDVLPLPVALTVISDQDHGCSMSPIGGCVREVDVKSTAGISTEQTMQAVNDALARLHGWRLNPPHGGCRYEGWLLGREDVCVQVYAGQNAVRVLLKSNP